MHMNELALLIPISDKYAFNHFPHFFEIKMFHLSTHKQHSSHPPLPVHHSPPAQAHKDNTSSARYDIDPSLYQSRPGMPLYLPDLLPPYCTPRQYFPS